MQGVGRGERRHLHGEEVQRRRLRSRTPSPRATRPATSPTSSRARTTRSASSSRTASWRPSTSARTRRSSTEPAVAGVTLDGQTYGVPWAVENVAMLTNKELAPTCPATLDEAVATAKKLIDDGKAPTASASRCRSARRATGTTGTRCTAPTAATPSDRTPDGSYNPDDMGVGKEGSIAAAQAAGAAGRRRDDQGLGHLRHRPWRRSPGQGAVLHHRSVADPRADRRPSATT